MCHRNMQDCFHLKHLLTLLLSSKRKYQAQAVDRAPSGLHLPCQSNRRARLHPQPSSLVLGERLNTLFSSGYFWGETEHLFPNFHNEATASELNFTIFRTVRELPRLLQGAEGSKGTVSGDAGEDTSSPASSLNFPQLAQLFPQTMLKVHRSPLHGW